MIRCLLGVLVGKTTKIGSRNIRDVLKIAKLCNPADIEEDIIRLISIHQKYRKTGNGVIAFIVILVTLFAPVLIGLIILAIIIGVGYWIYGNVRNSLVVFITLPTIKYKVNYASQNCSFAGETIDSIL